jgi:hypothetical protein
LGFLSFLEFSRLKMSKDIDKNSSQKKLRLEWVEAGTLTPNPNNWRRHSTGQIDAIKALIDDPEVGWAGVLLYNERTQRLIDGHARQKAVDPKTIVPVMVGSWGDEAEAKLLLALDPISAMADGDYKSYQQLMQLVTVDNLDLRDLLDKTAAGLGDFDDQQEPASGENKQELPEMELRPFEHYDYVVVLARTTTDWEALCELLQLKKVNCSPIPGKVKVGLGRAVDAARVIRLIKGDK